MCFCNINHHILNGDDNYGDGGDGDVHLSLLHAQATVSECLSCSSSWRGGGTYPGSSDLDCSAGDAARTNKYGLDHGNDDMMPMLVELKILLLPSDFFVIVNFL